MKNHLLWLRCLPWYRHGLKFMPLVPVPTWYDYKWTYGQTQAPTKSRFKTPETLINTLLTRLYQERHSPDEAEFPLLPWGTEEHKAWQASWRRIISSWIQMSVSEPDIPQTTIFLPFGEQQFSTRDNCVSAPTKDERNKLRWLGYPKG